MREGVEDVPALFSGCGDDGTQGGEVTGARLGAEAALVACGAGSPSTSPVQETCPAPQRGPGRGSFPAGPGPAPLLHAPACDPVRGGEENQARRRTARPPASGAKDRRRGVPAAHAAKILRTANSRVLLVPVGIGSAYPPARGGEQAHRPVAVPSAPAPRVDSRHRASARGVPAAVEVPASERPGSSDPTPVPMPTATPDQSSCPRSASSSALAIR